MERRVRSIDSLKKIIMVAETPCCLCDSDVDTFYSSLRERNSLF